MLTKLQKAKQIEIGRKLIEESRSLIFVDFGGVSVKNLENLRRKLKEVCAHLKVIKKRLLRIAFENRNLDFNPERFELQAGTIFSPKEIYEVAGLVLKSGVKVLGGYDLELKDYFDAEKVKFFGNLPSREILLGQLAGMLAAPMRMFMYVLQERSKKVVSQKSQIRNPNF
ncbi:MAG: 50S ribosomal protein L10 [Candidatus Magasanikbacteria bacterium]|nr:50S ribosomal protein L10 [Candidatus Magasanikbacteria bacterium]